jgi:hypothetical protein
MIDIIDFLFIRMFLTKVVEPGSVVDLTDDPAVDFTNTSLPPSPGRLYEGRTQTLSYPRLEGTKCEEETRATKSLNRSRPLDARRGGR